MVSGIIIKHWQFKLTPVTYLHTVKWLNCSWSNSSIWPIDGTLIGIAILGQSGAGSNGNKR